ncbi:MAG: VOC family protein [Candidatus Eiseniibacteriota bacterium]|jgi:catechol 2,3-dioxygenase-like lactoylglutathione lyase family enzyme
MKLGHIELRVADPERARRFYEEALGLRVVADQEGRFIWLDAGSIEILLRPGVPPDGAASYDASALGLVVYVDDLPATAAALRARGVALRPVDGDDRCLSFADPDGHWYQLVDPRDHQ